MFDFLKKKASIQLELNTASPKIGEKISGKITITPMEDFESNSLEIRFTPSTVAETFDCPPAIKRVIQSASSFSSNGVVEVPFEVDFATQSELDEWYDYEVRGSGGDAEYGHDLFMNEVCGTWLVEVYFDIPGFDISEKTTVQVGV